MSGKSEMGWFNGWREWWFFKDTRSAVVGSLFAAVISTIAAAWHYEPVRFEAVANAQGLSRPLPLLLESYEAEDSSTKYALDPPELSDTIFCEYVLIEGSDWSNVLRKFFDRFSNCFTLKRMSEFSYVVTKKSEPTSFAVIGGKRTCSCS